MSIRGTTGEFTHVQGGPNNRTILFFLTYVYDNVERQSIYKNVQHFIR